MESQSSAIINENVATELGLLFTAVGYKPSPKPRCSTKERRPMSVDIAKVLWQLVRPAYFTSLVTLGISITLIGLFGVLDAAGVTEGQMQQILSLPEHVNAFLNQGIDVAGEPR